MIKLQSARKIKLDVIDSSDAEFLFRLMNSPKWLKYIGDREIDNIESAKQYIKARMSPNLSEKGFINHVIIDKETNEKVGTCSLHKREGVPGMDIGYAILPQFEGNGYAYEGAKAMIKLAFETYKQSEIYAITTDENNASCGLLFKLGFKKDSLIRLKNSNEALRLFRFKITTLPVEYQNND